ncbi:hypothetical protein ACLMJK_002667 [Lecanora helva]
MFSFNFKEDDIETNATESNGEMTECEKSETQGVSIEPKLHDLKTLLETLPSKVSYSTIEIPKADGAPVLIPRRELFDIKAQLMAEDQTLNQSIVAGLSADDILPSVYEGGFKTWECSLDLAQYLSEVYCGKKLSDEAVRHIIEVGAGTSLPTLVLFSHFFKNSHQRKHPIHLWIADYNISVLEACVMPNLVLTWHLAHFEAVAPREGDLEITSNLISSFLEDISDKSICIHGISGAWGDAFCQILDPLIDPYHLENMDIMFLASETIYSPSSIRSFVRVLSRVLRATRSAEGTTKALIAAKRIYFGVGGGVDEFLKILEESHGSANSVWESKGTGVGRVILEVVMNS